MLPRGPRTLIIVVLTLGLSSNSVAGNPEEATATLVDPKVEVTSPVSRTDAQECSRFETCSACLDAENSSCGWCLLENKCNVVSDCPEIPNTLLQWFTKANGKCPAVKSVTPDQAQKTTVTDLTLVLEDFPTLTGRFRCAFTIFDETLITDAVRDGDTIKCSTPQSDLLPAISEEQRRNNEYHYTAKLSIRRTIGPDLVSTNFLFFDCSAISSCTTCVTTSSVALPCDFCIEKNKCTHDTKAECPTELLNNGSHMHQPGSKISANLCPRLNEFKSVGEHLVSSGLSKSVRADVFLTGQFMMLAKFGCEFTVNDRVVKVDARLLADTVYCDEVALSFEYKDNPTLVVPFTITWGGSKALDNLGNMHLVLYHCNKLAESCEDCNTLDGKYGCGWCGSTNTCETKEQCKPVDSTWFKNNTHRCSST